jgi:hypothetical protein
MTPCAIWAERVDTSGYGVLWFAGRAQKAHRVAYALTKGPVPAGHHLHHLCGVRRCCNPEHLDPVTPSRHRRVHRRATCARGHSMANAIVTKLGTRKCRVCHNAAKLRWFHARS